MLAVAGYYQPQSYFPVYAFNEKLLLSGKTQKSINILPEAL